MTLSELIAAYGDDKVQFQNLDQAAVSLNMRGAATRITFGTEQRIDFKGTAKLGLVVWMDRDRVKATLAGRAAAIAAGAASPSAETPVVEARRILEAPSHALRSYEFGNASPELARTVADACDGAVRRLAEAQGGTP